MQFCEIALHRLHNSRLTGDSFAQPEDVVKWSGAIQSQEYAGAKWSLGMRMKQAVDADIEKAFNDGRILRTHVMRPTWHFVPPEDIRWMQALTAPRVKAINATMDRQLELDDAILGRSSEVIAKALQGGKHLTRSELGEVLAQAGIEAQGMRLGYIIHRAELEAIICSGPRKGKQFTYALIEERAPQAKTLDMDEALVTLILRYFTSHGPATVKDFVWWSGLTVAMTKAGLELVGSKLMKEEIEGKTYWYAPSTVSNIKPPSMAYLLQDYDEFTLSYADRSASIDASIVQLWTLHERIFTSPIVFDGKVIGAWRRTFKKDTVTIQSKFFWPLTSEQQTAFEDAAERYGKFIGMKVAI